MSRPVGYNGDVLQSRNRARGARKNIEITYAIPKQGSREKLAVQLSDTPEQTRAIVRGWQKFKTGQ